MHAKRNLGLVPPAILVSFGGTGFKEDAAVTQYAGGSVESVDLTQQYVPALVLLVLGVLLIGSSEQWLQDDINATLDSYLAAIPDPCYYCHLAPKVTVYEMYSVLVGANSTPLEYVNQIPDHYIRQWPSRIHFPDPGDLPTLYGLTSAFFTEQTAPSVGPVKEVEKCVESGCMDSPVGTNAVSCAQSTGLRGWMAVMTGLSFIILKVLE